MSYTHTVPTKVSHWIDFNFLSGHSYFQIIDRTIKLLDFIEVYKQIHILYKYTNILQLTNTPCDQKVDHKIHFIKRLNKWIDEEKDQREEKKSIKLSKMKWFFGFVLFGHKYSHTRTHCMFSFNGNWMMILYCVLVTTVDMYAKRLND